MLFQKIPIAFEDWREGLLVQLESEQAMGWSIVSPAPHLDEKSPLLKAIVTLVHGEMENAENE